MKMKVQRDVKTFSRGPNHLSQGSTLTQAINL